jgi:hypothetical protein
MVITKRKRGEKHPSEDLYFWRYMKTSKNGEYWVTLEELNRLKKITRAQTNLWSEKNPEKVKMLHKMFLEKNPGYQAKVKAKQRILRGEELKKYQKEWGKRNPDKIRAMREKRRDKVNLWKREKIKNDPLFAIKNRIRSRIGKFIQKNGNHTKNKSELIIGCSWLDLKTHIENQFTDGMTWENRGEWHIDHIIPLASAKTVERLYELFQYTNKV